MTVEQQNNPLHGLKQDMLLTELVEYYGWDILAAQINLNCFKSNPSIDASLKFLRKVEWARLRLEAFYLYKFKSLPLPSDEQHKFPPRERLIDTADLGKDPAPIDISDREFFDDPISGPVYTQTRRNPKEVDKSPQPTKESPQPKKDSHEPNKESPQLDKNSPPTEDKESAEKETSTTQSDDTAAKIVEKQEEPVAKPSADPWAAWRDKGE